MLLTSILRIVAFIYPIGSAMCLIQHGYMTHYYFNHKPVFVNDSMILELTNKFLSETPAERFLTCDVNIVTSASRKLMIHFLSLEISYADKDMDRLHIYDYKSTGEAVRISPPQGLYGISDAYYTGNAHGVEDYVSSGNRLKLDYQGKPTLAYNGFKILITSFRDARGDCGRGYIWCNRKDICIPVTTWCDGNPNCGIDDESDEASCNQGPLSTWNPLDDTTDDHVAVEADAYTIDQQPRKHDGLVTAVVAVSVSFTLFFIIAAILVICVLKMNKRDVTNQTNITVEFKKKRTTKRQASKTRDYAPPAYEVVIGMAEDPPPYQLVASPDDTGSDVSDDEELHVLACGGEPEYSTIVETARVTNENIQEGDVANLNNIRVTCDIHGDNVEPTEVAKQNGTQPNGCMELTKYRLCSQGPSSDNLTRQDSRRGKTNSLVIEVLHSGSESEDDSDTIKPVCNGKPKAIGVHQNGRCKEPRLNGHSRVAFSSNQTASDDSKIELIGNEP